MSLLLTAGSGSNNIPSKLHIPVCPASTEEQIACHMYSYTSPAFCLCLLSAHVTKKLCICCQSMWSASCPLQLQHMLSTGKKDLPNKGADQKDFQNNYASLTEELKQKTSAHLVIKSDEVSSCNCMSLWPGVHVTAH